MVSLGTPEGLGEQMRRDESEQDHGEFWAGVMYLIAALMIIAAGLIYIIGSVMEILQ